jgi:probable phosphoglycerate mutase
MPASERASSEPGAQEVVLVRHGETEWSRSGRHTSHTNLDLTDGGRGAAAALAPVLARRSFGLVLASPMHRSLETARLAGFDAPEVREDLREWDYGEYEGRTTAAIRRDVPEWTVFTHPVPGGETIDAVAERVDRVIAEARATPGAVLIFGHGHALRVLGARWCDFPPLSGRNLALQPASVSVLTYERETPVLGQWDWLPDLT